jgi:hypothetical protein
VCGGVFVRFTPEDDSSAITSIQLLLDGTEISVTTATRYEYYFDTQLFPVGLHTMAFHLHEPEVKGRLLNVLNYPSRIYSSSIVFKQASLPSAPTNVQFHWVYRGHPYVTWSYPSTADSLVDHISIERTFPTRFSATIAPGLQRYDDTSIVCTPVQLWKYMVGMANRSGINYSECTF